MAKEKKDKIDDEGTKKPTAKKSTEKKVIAKKSTTEKTTEKKAIKNNPTADKNAKEYSVHQKYAVGDQIFHRILDDKGTVAKLGKTTDNLDKMLVNFEKSGKKVLVFNMKK